MKQGLRSRFSDMRLSHKFMLMGALMSFALLVVFGGLVVGLGDLNTSVGLANHSMAENKRSLELLNLLDQARVSHVFLGSRAKDILISMDEGPESWGPGPEADQHMLRLRTLARRLSAGMSKHDVVLEPVVRVVQDMETWLDLFTRDLPATMTAMHRQNILNADTELRWRSFLTEQTNEANRQAAPLARSLDSGTVQILARTQLFRTRLHLAATTLIQDRNTPYLDQGSLFEARTARMELLKSLGDLERAAAFSVTALSYARVNRTMADLVEKEVIPGLAERIRLGGLQDIALQTLSFRMDRLHAHILGVMNTAGEYLTKSIESQTRDLAESQTALAAKAWGTFWSSMGIVLFAGIGLGLSFWAFARELLGPLAQATSMARQIETGNYQARLASSRKDEIGTLMHAMDSMAHQIHEVNSNLEQLVADRTSALSTAMENLQEAQGDLVRSERLASMAPLLFGVAHELNTPLGNCVTLVSFLAGGIDNPDSFPDRRMMAQSLGIVMDNLRKAVVLLQRFKGLSTIGDESPAEVVDVGGMVQESLAIALSERSISPDRVVLHHGSMVLKVPRTVMASILDQLVANALDHAMPEDRQLVIELGGPGLEEGCGGGLVFSDNGRGMDQTTLARIGEPFHTTARGKGQAGLGTYLVRTLVEQRLKGTFCFQSAPGGGTRITIGLPMQAQGVVQ